MQIIQTTTSLAPEFGGPARSVPALSLELARLGNQVTVLSLDFGRSAGQDDLPTHPNLDYVSVAVHLKIGLRPLLVPDFNSTLQKLIAGKKELIIHDNGIWLPYSGVIHRVARESKVPLITSIRGMLEPWALKYGRMRKLAAWYLFQKKRLEANAVLHATSRQEAANLRALGLGTPIALLPNGTTVPDMGKVEDLKHNGKKTLLFLSRIHPKKGLLNLVSAVSELRPAGWRVVLAGYDEGGYWDIIHNAIKQAGVEEYFTYLGPVSDREKWPWYKLADLFILPSYSENFGLVVAESLASGTPVITTRGTPWEDLIDYNCGWWVEPDVPELTASLQEAFSLGEDELKKMGQNGRRLIKEKYSWPVIAARMEGVYRWILNRDSQPPEVII